MNNFLKHFDSRIVPHFRWEMALMRLLFSLLVFSTIPSYVWFTTQPHPNGLAQFLDLTFLSDANTLFGIRIALGIALFFYTFNFLTLPSLAIMLFVSVSYGSLLNSQGAMNHGLQPVSLVILGQFIVAAYFAMRHGVSALWQGLPEEDQRLMIHAAKVAIVSVYVVSGVTKIQRSKGAWIWETPNIAAQVMKTADDKYYTRLQIAPNHIPSTASWMAAHPNWTRVALTPALLLELFAFLALINRLWGLFIGIALIGMHTIITFIMQLGFFELKTLDLIFLINIPFIFWMTAQYLRKGRAAFSEA